MSIDFSTLDQQRLLAERVKNRLSTLAEKADALYAITDGLDDLVTDLSDTVDDLSIPTKTSDLTNDSKFQTDSDVAEAIANADKLSRKEISSLSEIDLTAEDVDTFIYMLPIVDSDGDTYYQQYMVIGGEVKPMGTTKIDLEGYLTEDDVATDEEVDAAIDEDLSSDLSSAFSLEFLKDLFLGGAVPYGKELKETWENLQVRIKAGDLKGIHIGDYKSIVFTTGELVVMEVSGIDQYYRCGDPTHYVGHHVDFISRNCLSALSSFNDTPINNGNATSPNPWRASMLFSFMNDLTTGIYAKLPENLKTRIIEKVACLEYRYSPTETLNNDNGYFWESMGKLWLPSEVEIFGTSFFSDYKSGRIGGGGCNLQYPIFKGGAKHLIKGPGTTTGRCAWWTINPRFDSYTNIVAVNYDGNADNIIATNTSIGIPLCFRIG